MLSTINMLITIIGAIVVAVVILAFTVLMIAGMLTSIMDLWDDLKPRILEWRTNRKESKWRP